MQEITSNAIGAFNFTVDGFNGVQLTREFKDDFPTYQLTLDILQIRLSRWGEVAGITANKNTNASGHGPPSAGQKVIARAGSSNGHAQPASHAERYLAGIQDTFLRAQRDAKTMKGAGTNDTLDPERNVPTGTRDIREHFHAIVGARRKASALAPPQPASEPKWAFYRRDDFERFATSVSTLIDGLEKLVPDDARQSLRELSAMECGGLSHASLEALESVVKRGACDPWLERAVAEELRRTSGTSFSQSNNKNCFVTGLHYGGSYYGLTTGGYVNVLCTGPNSTVNSTGHKADGFV